MQETFRGNGGDVFPFKLEDLASWTVRRTDGSVATFTLAETAREKLLPAKKTTAIANRDTDPYWANRKEDIATKGRVTESLSAWCDHTPKDPIAEFDAADRKEIGSPLRLYVGDAFGAKKAKDNFDFVIDGGDVISLYGSRASSVLEGDPELVTALRTLTVFVPDTRVMKIDWVDRKAPDVIPEFWVELNKLLYGDVMTCCQGGHGRSGTSFVCLLMVNSPDYDARDAITHLRAVHCPRAIESVVQHDYINDVAKFLGREANAHSVKDIKDYKVEFAASERPSAIRMRKQLGWK